MESENSRFAAFLLPSPILCDGDALKWEHIQLKHGYSLTIYSPFISADLRLGHHPAFAVTEMNKRLRLRSRSGSTESRSIPLVRMLPLLNNVSEKAAMFVDPQPSAKMQVAPIDTVCLEISGKGPSLSEFLQRFLQAARRRTLQAWLGRSTTALGTNLELYFSLDSHRHPLGTPVQKCRHHFGFPDVMRMGEKDWKDCWLAAAEPWEEDGFDAILDAYFEKIEGRGNAYFLRAGLAMEIMKYMLWDYLRSESVCDRSWHKKAIKESNEPYRYFGTELRKFTGQSFELENPKCYKALQTAWKLRGLVTHAKTNRINSIVAQNEMSDFQNDLWFSLRELYYFVSRLTRKTS